MYKPTHGLEKFYGLGEINWEVDDEKGKVPEDIERPSDEEMYLNITRELIYNDELHDSFFLHCNNLYKYAHPLRSPEIKITMKSMMCE